VVKAKLGAPLAAGQVAGYIADLTRRVSGGDCEVLVVVLVPAYRCGEAALVLDQALSMCGQPPIRTAV
jgi:hypothetical protein